MHNCMLSAFIMVLQLVDVFLYISSISWSAGYRDYSDMARSIANNMVPRLNVFDPDAMDVLFLTEPFSCVLMKGAPGLISDSLNEKCFVLALVTRNTPDLPRWNPVPMPNRVDFAPRGAAAGQSDGRFVSRGKRSMYYRWSSVAHTSTLLFI